MKSLSLYAVLLMLLVHVSCDKNGANVTSKPGGKLITEIGVSKLTDDLQLEIEKAENGLLSVALKLNSSGDHGLPDRGLIQNKKGFIDSNEKWFVCHLSGNEIWVFNSGKLEKWFFQNGHTGVEAIGKGDLVPQEVQKLIRTHGSQSDD